MRGDDTPISIAFRDPVLRASGMANDTFGEAKRFFELTDGQLHDVICYCHFGATLSASTAARNVRAIIAGKDRKRSGCVGKIARHVHGIRDNR